MNALLARARAGDAAAWGTLLRASQERLIRKYVFNYYPYLDLTGSFRSGPTDSYDNHGVAESATYDASEKGGKKVLLLKSVTEYGSDEQTALPPITFDYVRRPGWIPATGWRA